MRTIIAGSRGYGNKSAECDAIGIVIDEFMESPEGWKVTEVVSGGARGVDKAGEIFAAKRRIPVTIKLPDWKKLGRSAGYIRNKQMANISDALIAFWDGESKGTRHMINIAREKGLKIKMFYIGRKL